MKHVNSDVAYDFIRKRILSGEYPPDHALMTKELAAEIGVSRTPVRDALRQLEADGLVTILPHLGASVKSMQAKEYREMCDLRLALESHAAGLAAKNRTDEDLKEMRLALESLRKITERVIAAAQDGNQSLIGQLVHEDVRFHIAIMTAAKSDLMKKEILRLHLINRIVSVPYPSETKVVIEKAESDARRQSILESHQEIFQAIERGDAIIAKNAMEHHIQDIIDHQLRLMARATSGPMARELTDEELSYTT
jgi:DNA-binding GntR family transcriptional regulator